MYGSGCRKLVLMCGGVVLERALLWNFGGGLGGSL